MVTTTRSSAAGEPGHTPGPHIVVMGVSGAGKSTVARAIAERAGTPFLDADDLHPTPNRRKLAAGDPLTDDDRWPWLAAVRDRMRDHDRSCGPGAPGPARGLVVACSALRRAYRDVLREVRRPVFFVELGTDPELIAARLAARRGHFASDRILESQVLTLEPLEADEDGMLCPISRPTDEIAGDVLAVLAG